MKQDGKPIDECIALYEEEQAKMAESAANLLREDEDDEFPGILGMMLDFEFD